MTGALELGGSHVTAARVDPARGRVDGLVRTELRLDAPRDELLERIAATAREGAAGATALGVATPGPFDYARGVCLVRGLGKLESLYGVDLRSELAAALELEPGAIAFVNDAEAFVLGEAAVGAARRHARVIGLTLGTGLGSAFLAGGELVREGPEVPPGGDLHVLTFRGRPVEDTLSGRGLRGEAESAQHLAAAARAGDAAAGEAFVRFGTDLGEFLEPWVRAFEPTCVVVGGAIAHAWDLFGAALQDLVPVATGAERIEEAALIGAVCAAGIRGYRTHAR